MTEEEAAKLMESLIRGFAANNGMKVDNFRYDPETKMLNYSILAKPIEFVNITFVVPDDDHPQDKG